MEKNVEFSSERLLGIKRTLHGWALNWPMTVMVFEKK